MTEFVKKIRTLYEEGRVTEALEEIDNEYPFTEDMPVEVLEVKGWCHFRKEEYDDATRVAIMANSLNGDELLAQIAAYVTKDDDLLMKMRQKHPESLGVCNALNIRAKDSDSTISVGAIVGSAIDLIGNDSIAATNFINNTGRLLMEKGNGRSDNLIAIGLWQIALIKYGSKNYHHRAAVNFWISKAYEGLGNKKLAILAIQESARLWNEQCELEPENQKFQNSREGAKKRLQELEES
jgi:hypothetical protein